MVTLPRGVVVMSALLQRMQTQYNSEEEARKQQWDEQDKAYFSSILLRP